MWEKYHRNSRYLGKIWILLHGPFIYLLNYPTSAQFIAHIYHPQLLIVHCLLSIFYYAQYIVHILLCTANCPHFIMHSLLSTFYDAQSIVHILLSTVYCPHFIVHSLSSTDHNRTMRMMDNIITNRSHDCPPNLPKSSCSHHNYWWLLSASDVTDSRPSFPLFPHKLVVNNLQILKKCNQSILRYSKNVWQ